MVIAPEGGLSRPKYARMYEYVIRKDIIYNTTISICLDIISMSQY
jgi:hypothetical protein